MKNRALQLMVCRQMNTMSKQPVVTGQTTEFLRCLDVVNPLGNMDVDTNSQILCKTGRGLQGLLGASKGRMDANEPKTTGLDEAFILGQPATGAVGTVPIRDSVSRENPDPTSAHASAMTSRLPSMALGDS